MTKQIIIKPSFFVDKPYYKCPKCGKRSFGVLMINNSNYIRRCNNCMHSDSFDLPKIQKKVIYIDQMAISNMMNSIWNKSQKTGVKKEFRLMFEKLDCLNKLQLIVCPASPIHENESVVTSVFKELKQMYEHLANGVEFWDWETVVKYQLYESFNQWIGNTTPALNVHNMVLGSINEWTPRLRISIDRNRDIDFVKEVKKYRDTLSSGLSAVFNRWQSEKGKPFKYWYKEERDAFGPAYFESYIKSVFSTDPTAILSQRNVLIVELRNLLLNKGYSDEKQILVKIAEFFHSDIVKEILYNKLYSMLASVIAKQASMEGRMQAPNQGTSNDLTFIAAYSPYCDALFIDNASKELVKQGDNILKLGIKEKFFSENDFEGFFRYLDNILLTTPRKHINKVKEVYGSGWVKPFVEMYN